MTMTVQYHPDHIRFVLNPRLDGVEEWDRTICIWLAQYVNFNSLCPFDNSDKAALGAELLGAGTPIQNWVAQWKNSDLRLVWLTIPRGSEWMLQINACSSANSSTAEYRVFDLTLSPPFCVDDAGNLTTKVLQAPAATTRLGGSPVPPGAPATAPVAPVQPQQVAATVADANAYLKSAGDKLNTALNKLVNLAVQMGVNKTQAALEQLVKVGATAGAR